MDWQTIRNQFMRTIGGDPPGAQLEDELIAAYTDHPDVVERSIEKIALAHKAGKIRSPWGALKAEVAKATEAARNPTHDKGSSKTKAIARAEQWIRNTGIHYDRETEILDELFGDHGTLRGHRTPDLEQRILNLWHDQRPIGEQLEAEHEQRMARYRDQPKPERATKTGNLTADELKALAHRKSLLPTADEIAGILNDDHPGVPNWKAREAALADTTDAQT